MEKVSGSWSVEASARKRAEGRQVEAQEEKVVRTDAYSKGEVSCLEYI